MRKLIAIGRILRPWGNKGEVKIALFSGKVKHLATFSRILIGHDEESAVVVSSEKERKAKDSILVKFSTIHTIEDAETLRGCFLYAPAEELAPPQKGEYYIDDLVGMKVFHVRQEEELGKVTGIMETGGTDLLEIRRDNKKLLIPLTKSICKVIDMKKRRVIVDPPEGLLELDEI